MSEDKKKPKVDGVKEPEPAEEAKVEEVEEPKEEGEVTPLPEVEPVDDVKEEASGITPLPLTPGEEATQAEDTEVYSGDEGIDGPESGIAMDEKAGVGQPVVEEEEAAATVADEADDDEATAEEAGDTEEEEADDAETEKPKLTMDVGEPPASALRAARMRAGDSVLEKDADLMTLAREAVKLLREIRDMQFENQGGPFLG